MCGRYGRRGDKQKIAEAFHIDGTLEDVDFDEDLDAAPGSVQPVVLESDHGERKLSVMRWGFKLPDRLLFNVRAEGVTSASFWKDKFADHRCIVPASSYFEWQNCNTKPKPKFEIAVPGREYIGIAAVWAPWRNPKTNLWEKTFSTFTSEPNPLIEKIHIRQPVILEPRDYDEWLHPSERPPMHLLRITPEEEMSLTPINLEPTLPHEAAMKGLFDEDTQVLSDEGRSARQSRKESS